MPTPASPLRGRRRRRGDEQQPERRVTAHGREAIRTVPVASSSSQADEIGRTDAVRDQAARDDQTGAPIATLPGTARLPTTTVRPGASPPRPRSAARARPGQRADTQRHAVLRVAEGVHGCAPVEVRPAGWMTSGRPRRSRSPRAAGVAASPGSSPAFVRWHQQQAGRHHPGRRRARRQRGATPASSTAACTTASKPPCALASARSKNGRSKRSTTITAVTGSSRWTAGPCRITAGSNPMKVGHPAVTAVSAAGRGGSALPPDTSGTSPGGAYSETAANVPADIILTAPTQRYRVAQALEHLEPERLLPR